MRCKTPAAALNFLRYEKEIGELAIISCLSLKFMRNCFGYSLYKILHDVGSGMYTLIFEKLEKGFWWILLCQKKNLFSYMN